MLATLAAIVFSIYFVVIQYYVLLIEIIMILILLVTDVFELLIGFFSCWQFQSYEKQQWLIDWGILWLFIFWDFCGFCDRFGINLLNLLCFVTFF